MDTSSIIELKKGGLFKRIITKLSRSIFSYVYKIEKIISEKEQERKNNLLAEFFEHYQEDETKIRYIGTSYNLEAFFKLEINYFEYLNNPGRVSEKTFFDNLNNFYVSIENEFWEAHDIIYEDHLQFRSLNKKNIFFKIIIEFFILTHNLSTFIFALAGLYLYISIWNEYIQKFPSKEISQWLSTPFALLTLLMSIVLFSFTKILFASVKKENKRSNSSMLKIWKKVKSKYLSRSS